MKLNSNVKIVGSKTVLVPYQQHHVKKYHQWMQSEELQKLTASQPLTLEQEYDMQKSWSLDDDKCTFIILNKLVYDAHKNDIESMIGDTNIYITDEESSKGEIEIMIAEELDRGKRMGWEAVILMLLYGIQAIKVQLFEAKIYELNEASIQLFKKLGFREICRTKIFEEVTLQKTVSSSWVKWLNEQVKYEILPLS